MKNYKTNTKLGQWSANLVILGALLGLLSMIVGVRVLTLLGAGPDNVGLLALPVSRAALVGWSFVLSGLGNYLLWIPLALYCWSTRFGARSQVTILGGLVSLCGLGYLVSGATGALLLAQSWPASITIYQVAPAAEKALIAGSLLADQHAIESTYQGDLQNLLGALWLGGLAFWSLKLPRYLAALTWVLAAALIATTLGSLLSKSIISQVGLAGTMLLAPAWALGMGLCLKRWLRSLGGAGAQETR